MSSVMAFGASLWTHVSVNTMMLKDNVVDYSGFVNCRACNIFGAGGGTRVTLDTST